MIRVHGYLGTISDALREEVTQADLVVGGQRHLDALAVPDDKRQKLGLIGPAIERIQSLPDDANVVVIASGDPLFFRCGSPDPTGRFACRGGDGSDLFAGSVRRGRPAVG